MGNLVNIINEIVPFGEISETGLDRLITRVNGKDFAVASAYKGEHTRGENKVRQRQLHDMLNSHRIGGYRLVGYWEETPEVVSYADAKKDELKDVVEDSVFFIRPDNLPRKKFIDLTVHICRKFGQDMVIVGLNEDGKYEGIPTSKKPKDQREKVPNMKVYLYGQEGKREKVGNKLSLDKIAQAYSRMRGREDIPFTFKGILHPINNLSRQLFKVNNVLYERDSK